MRTVNETIEWIIFESDDPETWPSDEDDKNQFYLVRPSGHENFVVTARNAASISSESFLTALSGRSGNRLMTF